MSRYESAIGRFEAPNVDTLRPPLRKFSELPRWLEALSQLDLGSISELPKRFRPQPSCAMESCLPS